jgi:cytochrome c-type biogenesis protein CcmH/NrfG
MARGTRGTQHLKKQNRTATPRPPRTEDAGHAAQRRERQLAEQGLFFPKLRTHAKWIFLLLALVFAGSFVLFGVGSGSSGIGNVLQDWLNIGQSSGGPSVSKLEKKVAQEPTNAQAWRDLATAYETDQRTADAVTALERFTALRPKNADALQELAGQYQRQMSDIASEAQTAQSAAPVVDRSQFTPPATTPFGKAFASPTALQDPLTQALSSQVAARIGEFQTRYSAIQSKLLAVDKRVVALDPNDPNTQFQLAQVADATGDTAAAIAAYKRFLTLSPEDPLASQVKARLKQLSPPAKSGSG